jgi:hypothetical protein
MADRGNRSDDAPYWKVVILTLFVFLCCAAVAYVWFFLTSIAWAEGWDTDDPDLASWFATSVVHACCDQKDAYLADGVDGDGENIIAIITDGSANERYGKPAIPNGTRIIVPRDRMKFSPPVPGGHAVIFLSKDNRPPELRTVYCYFPKGLY